jgi:glycosyltransferase involved in cell wall biosynthesis
MARTETKAKIAVLIPAYNSASTIGETIKSLQDIESGWDGVDRVVLCDDDSCDNTLKVARRSEFSRSAFVILKHDKNKGEGASYRTMLGVIPEDVQWLLILHSDDLALSNLLTRNVEIVQRCGDRVAAVSSNYYVIGARSEQLAHTPEEDCIVFRSSAAEEIYHTATVGCWWHISGSVVNRKLWEQFGGRDPDLPQLGDWELMLRWQAAGYSVGHSLIATTKNRVHASSVSSHSYREFRDISERARIICANPAIFTPKIRKLWMRNIAKSAARRIANLTLAGRIVDAGRGIGITCECLTRLGGRRTSRLSNDGGAADRS